MRLFLSFLLTCSLLRADTLSDLKATLISLNGHDPVSATVTVESSRSSSGDKAPAPRPVTFSAIIEDDAQNLRISWNHELLQSSAKEAADSDDSARTRVRQAMAELSATTANDYLNGAARLLRTLELAELLSEKSETWQGQPARLLTFKLNPVMSEQSRKFIKEMEVTMKIWLGADGLPLAVENLSKIKGRAMLVITFESLNKEEFLYARRGQRLVVVRHAKDNSSSGAGDRGQQKSVATLTFKAP